MSETTQCIPELPVPESLPALSPDSVARLARLTREYARLSQGQAGLSSLLGGAFLLLVALVEMGGHGWHFTWIGALAPLPLPVVLGTTLLPFLWLGARRGLRRWATERFGLVEELENPSSAASRKESLRRALGRFILPGMMLLGVVLILAEPLSARFVRAGLVILLALGMHFTFPRLRGRMERFVAILLFFGSAFLLSGIQMAVGDTLASFPLVGTAAMYLGFRDHLAFRRVKRELEGMA